MEAGEVYRLFRFKLTTWEMVRDNFIWVGRDDFRYWGVRDMVTVSWFELRVWPRALEHWCDSLGRVLVAKNSLQIDTASFGEIFFNLLKPIGYVIQQWA
jgi:hypothetical protein